MHIAAVKGINSVVLQNVLLFERLMWFSDFDVKWKHSEALSQASESRRLFSEAEDSSWLR